jgi:hypothetical protein
MREWYCFHAWNSLDTGIALYRQSGLSFFVEWLTEEEVLLSPK